MRETGRMRERKRRGVEGDGVERMRMGGDEDEGRAGMENGEGRVG